MLENDKVSGIINIGSNKSTSHKELACAINNVFNNEGNLEFLKNLEEDKSISLMNSNKAVSLLDWRPKWTLQEALFEIKNKSKRL